MIRYVPDFIKKKYNEKNLTGSFNAYIFFLDIAGFTNIIEQKALHGQKGAAEINLLLQNIFQIPAHIFIKNGGFIAGFAGDSFLAFLPPLAAHKIQKLATKINKLCNFNDISTSLKVKISVGFGEINWQIYSGKIRNEFFFSGKEVTATCLMPHSKKYLTYTPAAMKRFNQDSLQQNEKKIDFQNTDKSSSLSFLDKQYHGLSPSNEIRDIACAFVSLKEVPLTQLDNIILQLQKLSQQYEVFLNKLDFTDKGLLALFIAGAPLRQEKILLRLILLARELVTSNSLISVGLCRGKCYAGFSGSSDLNEYTVLGFTPNLAARLMTMARPGNILVDRFTHELLIDKFDFHYKGKISIKGFNKLLPIYKLAGEKKLPGYTMKANFIGRDKEIKLILNLYRLLKEKKENLAVLVHGEAGIGKSSLIEYSRQYISPDEVIWCFLPCENIFSTAYAPVIKYLRSIFMINPKMDKRQKKHRFRSIWKEITGDKADLMKSMPYIAALTGIQMENEFSAKIPAADSQKYLTQALIAFFSCLAAKKVLVINIDDLQWIDYYTLQLITKLVSLIKENIFIIASCRFQNDGSKVKLDIDNLKKEEFILQRLPVKYTVMLVEKKLNLNYIPQDTESFIIQKSQCNPLFIEQITWFLKEKKLIDEFGFLNKNISYVNTYGILDIIGARLDRLSKNLKKIIEYAAILGPVFNPEILSKMLHQNVRADLDLGVKLNIWQKNNDSSYAFAHVLICDTAYSRMLENKQQKLHLMAADAYKEILEKDNLKDYDAIIAWHLEKGEDFTNAIEHYINAGKYYRSVFQLDNAEKYYLRAQKILPMLTTDMAHKEAEIKHLRGVIKCISGKHKDGIELFNEALSVFHKLKGENSLEFYEIIRDMSIAHREIHDLKTSLKYTQKEQELHIKYFPDKKPALADLYQRFATVYFLATEYDKAFHYTNKAIDTLKEMDASDDKLVSSYGLLAGYYHVKNDLDKALQYNLKVLNINKNKFPEGHYEIGRNYLNLAFVYEARNQLDEAIDSLKIAENIQINITGRNHPRLAQIYKTMAGIYSHYNDLESEEEFLHKAQNIYLDNFGEMHPETADCYASLGILLLNRGELEKAYSLLNKALSIRMKILGENSPYTAMSMRTMGKYHKKEENYEKALEMHRKALSVLQNIYGEFHPITSDDHLNIGEIYWQLRKFPSAYKYFKNALKAQKKCHHTNENTMAKIYLLLTECAMKLKNITDADSYLLKAEKFTKKSKNKVTLNQKIKEIKEWLKSISTEGKKK